MDTLYELIRTAIEKICVAAGLESNDIVNKMTDADMEYAEMLCQTLLGGFLEYGWQNGAKFDTPAIRVALLYSLYAGMVVQKYDEAGEHCSVEKLFAKIEENDGITGWTEKTLRILQVDVDFKLAAKFTALVDAYVNYAADDLPDKVTSGEDAVVCVSACSAMYAIGKLYLFDRFER